MPTSYPFPNFGSLTKLPPSQNIESSMYFSEQGKPILLLAKLGIYLILCIPLEVFGGVSPVIAYFRASMIV